MQSNKFYYYNLKFNELNYKVDKILSEYINKTYTDTIYGIRYWERHRKHKCYKCKEYGHIARDCRYICPSCKNKHGGIVCIVAVSTFYKRILQEIRKLNREESLLKLEERIKEEGTKSMKAAIRGQLEVYNKLQVKSYNLNNHIDKVADFNLEGNILFQHLKPSRKTTYSVSLPSIIEHPYDRYRELTIEQQKYQDDIVKFNKEHPLQNGRTYEEIKKIKWLIQSHIDFTKMVNELKEHIESGLDGRLTIQQNKNYTMEYDRKLHGIVRFTSRYRQYKCADTLQMKTRLIFLEQITIINKAIKTGDRILKVEEYKMFSSLTKQVSTLETKVQRLNKGTKQLLANKQDIRKHTHEILDRMRDRAKWLYNKKKLKYEIMLIKVQRTRDRLAEQWDKLNNARNAFYSRKQDWYEMKEQWYQNRNRANQKPKLGYIRQGAASVYKGNS